jgi:uncharacterized coiled-coil protein SlyX
MKSNFNIEIPQCIHGISASYECAKCLILNTKIPTIKEINTIKVEFSDVIKNLQKNMKALENKVKKIPILAVDQKDGIKEIKYQCEETKRTISHIQQRFESLYDCFMSLDHKVKVFFNNVSSIDKTIEDAQTAQLRYEKALAHMKDMQYRNGEIINGLSQKVAGLEEAVRLLTHRETK